MARDMQLAEELAAKEEAKFQRRNKKTRKGRKQAEQREPSLDNHHQYDGFHTNRLNADHMLFVNCVLDDNCIDILVDTGASSSAMSMDMVRALGLEHKLNRSVFGDAKGVGTSNIVGVVENVSMRISHIEFRVFFMVIDSQMPCCILGLDQMRRFKCLLDLDEHVLIFGGHGGVKVPFLPQDRAMLVAQQMIRSAQVADEHMEARTAEEAKAAKAAASFDSEDDYSRDDYSQDSAGGFGSAIKNLFRR